MRAPGKKIICDETRAEEPSADAAAAWAARANLPPRALQACYLPPKLLKPAAGEAFKLPRHSADPPPSEQLANML